MHSAFITASGVAPRNGIVGKTNNPHLLHFSCSLSSNLANAFFSYIFPCDTCIAGVLIFFGLTMVSQSFLTFRLDVIRHISPNEEREQLKCNKCGLFVLPTIPFLGATPDAVINAECIVEVKYPYGGKNEKIIPGEHFKFFCYKWTD
jgi:hypothetical protein